MFKLKTHNILDYVIAVFLILAPFLFGFRTVEPARNTFMSLGLILALYSLITKYYYSLAKVIPLGVHMTLDCLTGGFLILAPQIFDYRKNITDGQYILHLIAGIGALALVALSKPRTEAGKTPEEHAATDGVHSSMDAGPHIRV